MSKITKTFTYGGRKVVLETGQIARQASGSVMVRIDDTAILVAVVGKKVAQEGRDFFPLTVNYQEKYYAGGRIPGGYFKREGRPTEKETLTSRLIDRPIRPLFPKGFQNDVQIVATVMSQDPDVPTDIPALIGASAALAVSGMPFNGPIAAARVGFSDEKGYLLNPSLPELAESRLDLVVAGTKDAVLMVESEAQELTEEQMLGAVMFGHEQMQVVITAIQELADEVGTTKWDWEAAPENTELKDKISQIALTDLTAAYQVSDKMERQDKIKELSEKTVETLCADEENDDLKKEVKKLFHDLEAAIVRNRVLEGNPRIDGRDTKTVRPINIELGVLPRAHGSALFTRGETQAIVVTTLGTERDSQMIDDLDGDRKDAFMLHYNFPPYSVGETGMMTGPKRREIGHGKLAKRAVGGLLPHIDDFPYTIRIVSEITESNGSSSMATVCGSSLALMDAGVSIKAPVAGIAMGLIKEADKYAVLTDILGDEDHLGDMDFKVAGTGEGITALQMDIKIDGITKEIMEVALAQAKDARMHILGVMNTAITEPRKATSEFAPRIVSFKINPGKIRDVIGKGGATIRELTEATNTTIDISDDGIIKVAAFSQTDSDAAKSRIEELVAEVEIGQIYEGAVVKLVDFGAFVAVLPGQQGLVHISQIAEERVENVHDYLKEGQTVKVKVIDIDRQGRVRLSMKEAGEAVEAAN